MNKKFILNADDFGMSKFFNDAVEEGYNCGLLKSVSLCANGDAFEQAVNDVIPKCKKLSVGVHLNIAEGHSLTNATLLTDKNGIFNKGYIYCLIKSFDKNFMNQVEQEFRAQIEKVMKYVRIDHIDSHVHFHSIPNIFKLTAKLAQEYNIPYIRTQYEKMYFVPSLSKHLSLKYFINILKIIILNIFTLINKPIVKKYGLKTNDFIIGVGYTGMMDNLTIKYGLKSLKNDCLAEALIHPCKYEEPVKNHHYQEYLITVNEQLKNDITSVMNFEITSPKEL